jgi:hypothetical protein
MLPSILLSTIVGTVVGLRLLLMSSRTRQFPEFAVGGALFCYATIAQTALFVTQAVGPEASHSVNTALLVLRLGAFYLTLIGLATFTWRVFGASSTWRKMLVVFAAVTAIGTMSGTLWAFWQQITVDGGLPLYARWGLTPQFTMVFAWMAFESLRYQRLMKKRQDLGLADPAVTNRFGIWGFSAGASSLLTLAVNVIILRSDNLVLGADPLSAGIVSATGIVNTIGWWLTFMPPNAYTNWIKGRVNKQATGGGHG